jgi:hypothetical protein
MLHVTELGPGERYEPIDVDDPEACKGVMADEVVCMEKGQPETALVYLGWDEIQMRIFRGHFKNPVHMRIVQ